MNTTIKKNCVENGSRTLFEFEVEDDDHIRLERDGRTFARVVDGDPVTVRTAGGEQDLAADSAAEAMRRVGQMMSSRMEEIEETRTHMKMVVQSGYENPEEEFDDSVDVEVDVDEHRLPRRATLTINAKYGEVIFGVDEKADHLQDRHIMILPSGKVLRAVWSSPMQYAGHWNIIDDYDRRRQEDDGKDDETGDDDEAAARSAGRVSNDDETGSVTNASVSAGSGNPYKQRLQQEQEECWKCADAGGPPGKIKMYRHVDAGTCWECGGTGYLKS